jgi:hypothetical protein
MIRLGHPHGQFRIHAADSGTREVTLPMPALFAVHEGKTRTKGADLSGPSRTQPAGVAAGRTRVPLADVAIAGRGRSVGKCSCRALSFS